MAKLLTWAFCRGTKCSPFVVLLIVANIEELLFVNDDGLAMDKDGSLETSFDEVVLVDLIRNNDSVTNDKDRDVSPLFVDLSICSQKAFIYF